jgi:hypothetical protein
MEHDNPYQPPAIPEEAEPPRARRSSPEDEYEALPFRSPKLLGSIVCLLMGIVMVLDLVAAYCAVAFYRASGGEFTPSEERLHPGHSSRLAYLAVATHPLSPVAVSGGRKCTRATLAGFESHSFPH